MSGERWPIPSTWQWSSADGIADIIGGGTPSTSEERNFSSDGIPWITPADLTGYSGTYIDKGARDLSQSGYNASGAQLMPKGTVLFSSRAPIGYCAISANEICTNQGFKSLVLKGDVVPGYIRYYLLSAKDYAESLASGTTFKELSGSRMAGLAVPVAPLAEQIRITKKVDALFARSRSARNDLAHIPKLIERYRQAVLEAAFRGDLTADWRKDNPSETGDGLKESVLGERKRHWEMLSLSERRRRYPAPEEADWFPDTEIPSQWTWMSVDQLAYQIQYGSSAKTGDDDSGTPVLRMGNIHRGKIRFDSLKYLADDHEEFPELLLKPGDILFNRTNSAELVGKTAVYEGNLRSASFASYLIRLKVSGIIPTLLAHYINSPFGRRWINSVVNQQVGQANVNGTKLSRLAVPVMSASEQAILIQRLNQRLFAVEAIEQEMRKSDGMLSRLDQAVLDKAFAGKLVPQDSNDEPASALLERIKAARVAAPRARRGRRPAVA